ncbi:aconitate hydratase AcnA [Candidatus Poribacteria bacterium]|nr:aconitate hydratase AcnA [Candidatus Poribacteria bacterium]MYF54419.1 aconitate hydratase AcnA [Candidatus Poribacteria bacterium]MYI94684.1 aconitate hydratase AcnA [Candidatus Poribacteria bacterium]
MPHPSHNLFNTRKNLRNDVSDCVYYSLPTLSEACNVSLETLPVSIRILLESLLRNFDEHQITEQDIINLANWNAKNPKSAEIPFKPARVVAQDFTGVPLVVDIAAMRSAVDKLGGDPSMIEPLVPVDLVIDHSIQVDAYGTENAFQFNTQKEFERNKERYEFLKWGQQAFEKFNIIPPSIGIVHQVNLEYLAQVVMVEDAVAYPDTLVGTDSHTTMINGLGIVGWGVGGIEAEAAMLGQPVYILTPEVLGVHMTGKLQDGVTATDLVLTVTQRLREASVVGKFVEFFGEGIEALALPDRATISNMCPEYGATIGFFPPDSETINYLRLTGRDETHVDFVETYLKAQGLFGIPHLGDVDYSDVLEIDLSEIEPSIAGPKRPQDRIPLSDVKETFGEILTRPIAEDGFGVTEIESKGTVKHGSVVISAITSCTNTSNPSVMIGAGLLAKKAVEKGLRVPDYVKTSLAPGSRVVTEYLRNTGLLPYLEKIGYNVVGYGCTTCIGNSGPLNEVVQDAIDAENLVTASVLSGNRNFEARVHPEIKANFLMSPPLVVAFGLAGRIDIDLATEPIGYSDAGEGVFLKDIWPTRQEIAEMIATAVNRSTFKEMYESIGNQAPEWEELAGATGVLYPWNERSTYIQHPPFFEGFTSEPAPISDIFDARILGIFGDSVTTDHISPAGAIAASSPAGSYLQERGVETRDFNTYGARRGNDRVMSRGTFANRRVRNLMTPDVEGGYTILYPEETQTTIYAAANRYQEDGIPTVLFAGQDYGMGSSRDWAAKGPKLLGVKAVVVESYERIHRSNLIGMGILPLQFMDGENAQSLNLDGSEIISITGFADDLQPGQMVTMKIVRQNGDTHTTELLIRIDSPVEVEYYKNGGILDYVIRNFLSG